MTSLVSFLPFPLQSYRRHNTAGFTGRAGREITPRLLPGEQEIQPAHHKMVLWAKLFTFHFLLDGGSQEALSRYFLCDHNPERLKTAAQEQSWSLPVKYFHVRWFRLEFPANALMCAGCDAAGAGRAP